MTFYEWIVENYYNTDSPLGDLAQGMATDEYTGENTYKSIHLHLFRCQASRACMATFKKAWNLYDSDPRKHEKTSLRKRHHKSAKPIIGCWSDSKDGFLDLPRNQQQALLAWIAEKLSLSDTYNPNHSSYGLKHAFTRDTGYYVNNAQFKDAMILSGFIPEDSSALNHQYKISEYSKAFRPRNCLAVTHHLTKD